MPSQTKHPAVAHLVAADERLAGIIRHVGPFRMQTTPDPYFALLVSIIHQQLSMKAAKTIRERVQALCPRRRITPGAIQALPTSALRAAGLSERKVEYVRDLTSRFVNRQITPARLRRMNDEAVIETVTEVRGIGRWTAEMLLLFCLERPDVWPVDDLGLRKAAQRLTGARRPLTDKRLHKLAEPWRPYRSAATWYLWRSLEGPVTPGLGP